MTKNMLLGICAMVATATVGQVWMVLTPNASAADKDQQTVKDEVRYIRERVDQIYNEVKK